MVDVVFSAAVVPGEVDELEERVLSFHELMELFVIGLGDFLATLDEVFDRALDDGSLRWGFGSDVHAWTAVRGMCGGRVLAFSHRRLPLFVGAILTT